MHWANKNQKGNSLGRILLLALAIWVAVPAQAHVSERAIVLLLPTDYFSAFGVLAVMFTVVLTIVIPPPFFRIIYQRPHTTPPMPAVGLPMRLSHGLAFLTFAALIAIGIWGPRDPLANLLPLSLFTVWWICLMILQATLGDIWRWINPWSGPVHWLTRQSRARSLPHWVGAWPAVFGLMLFATYYLVDLAPDDPARLAKFTGAYWLFTLIMGLIFGPAWIKQCETFTVLFKLAAHLSLFPSRRPQPFGRSLVHLTNPPLSLSVLTVTFLAIGSFDGLNETFWWFGKLGINPLEFAGRSSVVQQNLIGLIGFVFLLNLVFTACALAGYLLAGAQGNFSTFYRRLALTLLPIAIGYHLAHYLTSVMINLQYWVLALDDPLKSGWHLLGLNGIYTTTSFLNQYDTVTAIWLTQAGAIVIGHILAVILAHVISLSIYQDHKKAILSQVFLALFMVAYTFFGLWLLASPTAL